ncbi:hypothetical protein D5086_003715 [Populus alba]|uniref:Uncharacterized protein n=1 Tax=Populus alba TaxID=43335 RepID=A0ACC4D5H3_POPAL
MLRLYNSVKAVMVTLDEFSDVNIEVSWLSDKEDTLNDVEADALVLEEGARTLRSMKSEIRPGFVIFLSSTFFRPESILTTVDMEGRRFGSSWVQRRPIFRNLQASSALKSPFNDASTRETSSLRS